MSSLKFTTTVDVPVEISIQSDEFAEAVQGLNIIDQWYVIHVLMDAIQPADIEQLVEYLGKQNVETQILGKLAEFEGKVQQALGSNHG